MSRQAWMWTGLTVMVLGTAMTLGILRRRAASPPRPAQVPAAAQWAGTGPTGRFFLVEGRQGVVYTVHVFEARTGAKHPATAWKLVGFARTALGAEEIQGFDGRAIQLNDGSKLLPLE